MGSCKSKPELPTVVRKWNRVNKTAADFDGDNIADLISLALQASPYFQTMSIGHIRTLASNTQERDFVDMEPIYKEGDDSDNFFYLKSGRVEITSIAQGTIKVLSRGAIFGEADVVSRQKRTQNAISRGQLTHIIRISRTDYNQVQVNRNAVTELSTYQTLLQSAILMGLLEPELLTLHSHCDLEHFAPNEVIFKRGDLCTDKLYVVHKGSVTISEIASDYGLDSLWKLEWAGLNTYMILNRAGYFGDSSSDPSGLESRPQDENANSGGNTGHTVTATAGGAGADILTVTRGVLTTRAELRPVLERVTLNIQARDSDLRHHSKLRPLDSWLCKTGGA